MTSKKRRKCLLGATINMRYLKVKGCGANPDVDKYDVGCYSLFKAKFIDNIAVVGGDIKLIFCCPAA